MISMFNRVREWWQNASVERQQLCVVLSVLLLVGMAFVGIGVVSASSDGIFDTFEDGDITEWYEDPGKFDVGATAAVKGDYGLYAPDRASGNKYQLARSFDNRPDNVSVWVNTPDPAGEVGNQYVGVSSSTESEFLDGAFVFINNSAGLESPEGQGLGFTLPNNGSWYRIVLLDLNESSNTYTLVVENKDGEKLYSESGVPMQGDPSEIDTFVVEDQRNADFYVDEITVNGTETVLTGSNTISGVVEGMDAQPVVGVNVSVNDTSDTTNGDGEYELANLEDGEYELTASKDGYVSKTKTVSVSGGETKTVDFELREENESIRIDTREFVEHGNTVPFGVFLYNQTSEQWENVTSEANVTVENTDVVTVDQVAASMTATDNTSINDLTNVTATYDGRNDTQTVVVANETVENLDILPPAQKFTATIQDDNSIVILIATGVGAAAALFAGATAGVGAFPLVIIAAWVAGFTGTHVLIAALLISIMVGLNIAQQVQVRGR